MAIRVVSWNVAYRTGDTARRQGRFLAALRPDLVLLQEVNPRSFAALAGESGLDWLIRFIDLREPEPTDTPVRQRGVAIGGFGAAPTDAFQLDGIRLPERTLIVSVQIADSLAQPVSYHAPPGVNFGIDKPRQAVRCAKWLADTTGPVILGADANTPEYDMPDFSLTRTHWHSGMRKLSGEAGGRPPLRTREEPFANRFSAGMASESP
jgi:hypothetical protein